MYIERLRKGRERRQRERDRDRERDLVTRGSYVTI